MELINWTLPEKREKQTWSKQRITNISSMNECHNDRYDRYQFPGEKDRYQHSTGDQEKDEQVALRRTIKKKMKNALRRQERMITNHQAS